jgi:ADP-heptose:LPS heptosyltransferase
MSNSNLLIIHQGALGDLVLTFPAIIALHKKFNYIGILCQGQLGKLAAKLGLVDKAYPLETAYFATLFSDQIDEKIKDLICNYTSILVFSFSSDLKDSLCQITDGQCVQIPPRPPVREKIHVARFLFKNLIDSGLLEAADSNENRFTWQKRQAHRKGKQIDTSKIIIHPGSGSIRKRWPLTNFLDLTDGLEKRGLQPQLVCGPAEPDLIEEIRNQNRQIHTFSELTDLVDWFESAGGYIGNDSGVSHLAAFVGLPSVVIFGPSDPVRWKPMGPRVQIVNPELDCCPCFEIEPENCAEPSCLADASLDSVLIAFDQVYKL